MISDLQSNVSYQVYPLKLDFFWTGMDLEFSLKNFKNCKSELTLEVL